ncbi:MAG: ATP-binding protein [Saprospiraceae bacterium]|nr:ATP-binding protein [Saprospiraceae bacterium]
MQKNITRSIKTQMEGWLYRGKVLILYGARQVGKTTLSKSFLEPLGDQGLYLNCEIQSVQSALSIREPAVLRRFIGNKKLVVFDEAQYVPGIGEILKLLIDTFPDMQIIATGSSSFQLADRSSEALTGRALTFELYPFSYTELSQAFAPHELKAQLDFWLRFGFYPDIAFSSETDARTLLDNLSSRYLYQDVLEFENLKRAEVLVQLLQLLALQIGQLVSYHKKNKIFFYDIGIRNSIIQQYQPMELRSDKGALWENFLVVERLKRLQQLTLRSNRYFWRTYQDAEIDYIEERDGRLSAYEFKWQNKPARLPVAFANAYPGAILRWCTGIILRILLVSERYRYTSISI